MVEGNPVNQVSEGSDVEILLNKTPFYAESGGQIGDHGFLSVLEGDSKRRALVEIKHVQKSVGNIFVHKGKIVEGAVEVGTEVEAAVDAKLRQRAKVHHTATHLLQAALKSVIGEETSQAGSLVAFDRLRFDFNFHRPLQENEILKVEELINGWIGDATCLETKVMSLTDAKSAGATAMFGEKYGEQVYLAMEVGYSEKVDELVERYGLDGFVEARKPQANSAETRYLQINELAIEDIKWVDIVNNLLSATSYIEECKVIGVDCEWKPNYVKGSKPNKVSIMQIASEKIVFIFDLIRLYEDGPYVLDSCLKRILHSPSILKLGNSFQCDLKQFSQSYEVLECFKHYEMLLDIQNVFKESKGGLSGLAKKVLGASLNKTRRNSNWEQRPLTRYQMEYAALDAAVLIPIFHHICNQHQFTGSPNVGEVKMEWKSYIVSQMEEREKHKPEKTSKKADQCGTNS